MTIEFEVNGVIVGLLEGVTPRAICRSGGVMAIKEVNRRGTRHASVVGLIGQWTFRLRFSVSEVSILSTPQRFADSVDFYRHLVRLVLCTLSVELALATFFER